MVELISEQQPPQQPPQQQQPGPGPTAPVAPSAGNKYSAANDLMFEDCLKGILMKNKTGKTYCPYKTKFCPKPMQSPFGDFPPEYLAKIKENQKASKSDESKFSVTGLGNSPMRSN